MLGQHLKNHSITRRANTCYPVFGNVNFHSYFAVIQHYNEQTPGKDLQPTWAFYVKVTIDFTTGIDG